jgi:uncharacterized membrane protein YgcG
MRSKEFLSKLEHDRIVHAIREGESKTSGEIRVFIQRGEVKGDPLTAAQKKFHRFGMHKTRERNAVLIFVAPRAHKFAVVGDRAVHGKCGEQFWQRTVEGMRAHFKNEKFTNALAEAIEEIGGVLATHFPRTSAETPIVQLPSPAKQRVSVGRIILWVLTTMALLVACLAIGVDKYKLIGTCIAMVIFSVCTALFAYSRKVYASQSQAAQKRIAAIVAFVVGVVLAILIVIFIQARSRYGP